MPSSGETMQAMAKVLDMLGINNKGLLFEALLDLETAAWTAGYEAAKAGYERMLPS
jgi:hypothetical protein